MYHGTGAHFSGVLQKIPGISLSLYVYFLSTVARQTARKTRSRGRECTQHQKKCYMSHFLCRPCHIRRESVGLSVYLLNIATQRLRKNVTPVTKNYWRLLFLTIPVISKEIMQSVLLTNSCYEVRAWPLSERFRGVRGRTRRTVKSRHDGFHSVCRDCSIRGCARIESLGILNVMHAGVKAIFIHLPLGGRNKGGSQGSAVTDLYSLPHPLVAAMASFALVGESPIETPAVYSRKWRFL